MANKYYAVKKGRIPGIYMDWNSCKAQVEGFSGAEYKSFTDIKEANDYLNGNKSDTIKTNFSQEEINNMINNTNEIVAFVDGSYDKESNRYSFGLVALGLGKVHTDSCDDFEPLLVEMRNVAGEILGAQVAMEYCLANNIHNLKLYYDYEGIEKWATGSWKCNKIGTQRYKQFVDSIKDKLTIEFFKVPAHTGICYNEMADELAKNALK